MSNLGITEVVLRDGNQSLLATRITLEDLIPAAKKLDEIGYWSIESWMRSRQAAAKCVQDGKSRAHGGIRWGRKLHRKQDIRRVDSTRRA